jgi:hypothetical protein
LVKARRERRLALGDYLDNISKCVEGIVDAVTSSGMKSPNALCSELEQYGEQAPAVFSGMLDQKTAEALADRIKGATFYRALYVELNDSKNSPQALKELEIAVGHFRATANMLRAPEPMPNPTKASRSISGWFRELLRKAAP